MQGLQVSVVMLRYSVSLHVGRVGPPGGRQEYVPLLLAVKILSPLQAMQLSGDIKQSAHEELHYWVHLLLSHLQHPVSHVMHLC